MEVLIPIAQGFALMNPQASGQLRFPEEEPQTQKHRSFHPRFHAWNTQVQGIQMSPLLEWQPGVSICLEATLQAQNLWSAEEKKSMIWTKNCQKNQRSFEKKIARSGFFLPVVHNLAQEGRLRPLCHDVLFCVYNIYGDNADPLLHQWQSCIWLATQVICMFCLIIVQKLEQSKESQIKQCCFCEIQERWRSSSPCNADDKFPFWEKFNIR